MIYIGKNTDKGGDEGGEVDTSDYTKIYRDDGSVRMINVTYLTKDALELA